MTGQPTPTHAPKVIKYRNMSAKAQRRRAIKAVNYRMRSRAIKQQRAGNQPDDY